MGDIQLEAKILAFSLKNGYIPTWATMLIDELTTENKTKKRKRRYVREVALCSNRNGKREKLSSMFNNVQVFEAIISVEDLNENELLKIINGYSKDIKWELSISDKYEKWYKTTDSSKVLIIRKIIRRDSTESYLLNKKFEKRKEDADNIDKKFYNQLKQIIEFEMTNSLEEKKTRKQMH